MRISASLACAMFIAAITFAAPASASALFNLDTYVGAGTAPAGPYGSVLLTQDGANVDVLVNLAAAEGFAQTPGDVNAFYFDLDGVSSIDVTDISHGFTLSPANLNIHLPLQTTTAGSLNANAAGIFNYAIKCTVCGAQAFAAVPLSFTVDNVTIDDFIQNANGNYFAANLCIGKSHGTCVAEGETTAEFDPPVNTQDDGPNGDQRAVPEPATIAMFAIGLLALGGLNLRRRRSPDPIRAAAC